MTGQDIAFVEALRAARSDVLESGAWEGALTKAERALGARGVVLTRNGCVRGVYENRIVGASAGTPLEAYDLHQRWFPGQSARAETILRAKPGIVVHDADVGPLDALDRTPAYAALYHPFDIARFASIRLDQHSAHGESSLVLTLMRANHAEPPDADLVLKLTCLAHVIESSLNESAALSSVRQAQTIAGAVLAVLLLTGEGRVVEANRKGRALLQEGDGVFFCAGRMACRDRAAHAAFEALLRGPIRDAKSIAVPRARRPALGLVMTSRGELAGAESGVRNVCVIVDAARWDEPPLSLWRTLFGLTAAEAAVAALIVQGLDMAEIACRRGVARDTVHSQVKRIYEKLGVNRQAGAAALLTRVALAAPGACDAYFPE